MSGLFTLVAASIGFSMVTLDVTIVNVALPTLARDLGASLQALQWIVDGYTLTFAAGLLTGGALGDSFGVKRMYALGLALFALASAACGLSPSTGALIVARFIQGFGAALVVPCSLALVHNAYSDPDARGRAVAVWAAAGGAAVAAGPVVGGLLIHVSGWRSIFLVNVLIGLISLAITVTRIQAAPRRHRTIDVLGQLTAVAAVGGLTFAIIEGPNLAWDSPVVLMAILMTVAGAVTFVLYESRAPEAMLPPALMRRPVFVGAVLVGLLLNFTFYGQVFVLSLFFQEIQGQSALQTGLSFLPMTALIAASNLIAPRLAARTGSLLVIVSGVLLLACGLLAVLAVGQHSPEWQVAAALIPIGVGVGVSIPPLTSRVLDAVETPLAGVASGAFNACRQIGGAIGVALFGALLGGSQMSAFMHGMRVSLIVAVAAALLSVGLSLVLIRRAERQPLAASDPYA